ncbi:hypothetical protein SeMB42_g06067 [Synchytrium endobioticum]|uniref:Uncharacterized protein n=1 Tax=Synchytrium endobioticum TaxID=286115 RepID=A0A507CFI3_9FUNG|nr:hypothetical protein SeLEV6574_g07028 [Synchytrium endobioticum]TPX40270.1 hypothetical protein SeMB42_g06067 [Synchytrium endobioticum]
MQFIQHSRMQDGICRTMHSLVWTLILLWLAQTEAACDATSCPSGQSCCSAGYPQSTCFNPSSALCCTSTNAAWTCPSGSQCSSSTQGCESLAAATPSKSPSSTASVSPSPSGSNVPNQKASSGLGGGTIAGIVIGIIVAALVLCGLGAVGRKLLAQNDKNVIPAAPVYSTYNRPQAAGGPLPPSPPEPRPPMAPLPNDVEGLDYQPPIARPAASAYATIIPSAAAIPYPPPLHDNRFGNAARLASPDDVEYDLGMMTPAVTNDPRYTNTGTSPGSSGRRRVPDATTEPPTYPDAPQRMAPIHYRDPNNLS